MAAEKGRGGPSPGAAVRRELARALGGVALLPWRVADFLVCRGELVREFVHGLRLEADVDDRQATDVPRDRPLRIFVSCAETSGETHGANLITSLQARLTELGAPPAALAGFGGERLVSAGVRTLGNPVDRAAMGFDGMFASLPYYMGLLRTAAEHLRAERPDVCVLVDSPALHVPLAHIAQRYGVTVVHFVTPQLWAWAPWRVGGYRRAVDLALSILPFEPDWFARRDVEVAHVGHPRLDALQDVPTREGKGTGSVLAILAGSREGVIDLNLPWMLKVAHRLKRARPELQVVIPHDEPRFVEQLQRHVRAAGAPDWIEIAAGDLHGHLARADAALTVSGTVLIDLLHHRLPAVVIYRLSGRRDVWLSDRLLSTPWFSSINLVAGREVLPEYHFCGDGPMDEVLAVLGRCLGDPTWIRGCRDGLELAARRLGPTGASQRAADQVLRALPPSLEAQ